MFEVYKLLSDVKFIVFCIFSWLKEIQPSVLFERWMAQRLTVTINLNLFCNLYIWLEKKAMTTEN
jgi:hypothetical protein